MALIINTLVLLSRGIPGLVVAGVALILMVLGLVRKDSGLMVTAAFLVIPSTFMLGSWVGFLLVVRLMPLFLLASAFFISREDTIFAWLFPIPVLIFLVYYLVNLVAAGFTGV